ncbi:MAG: tRNA lysidine(34) synthetase TilS [Chlamydiae bacterium]|nr:tRNA lysidine(34) synthetase TilS [Chlamydiota bacterium]
MRNLIDHLKFFLRENLKSERPLLLGFSGGNDSLALLTLILECKKFFFMDIHLAHVDHRWRRESGMQAEKLKTYAQNLGLPFHLHVSSGIKQSEEAARKERFTFFQSLYGAGNYQALLLAHQAEDQVETILKRLFEGAFFSHWGGMKPVSEFKNMVIWRPLLKIPRKLLGKWLREKNLQPIDDETNRDNRYLRARMKQEIFPTLTNSFGKEVTNPLLRISDLASEIDQYFAEKVAPLFHSKKTGPFGSYFDLNPFFPLSKIELKVFIKKWAGLEELELSYDQVEKMVESLVKKKANCRYLLSDREIFLDRGILFYPKISMPSFIHDPLNFKPAFIEQGRWQWQWEVHSKEAGNGSSGWRQLWERGKVSIELPADSYQLLSPLKPINLIRNRWEKLKTPAFLRKSLPILFNKKGEYYEFLSGKVIKKNCKLKNFITIELKYRD